MAPRRDQVRVMTARAGRTSSRVGRRRIVILTEDSKPALGGIAEYLHQLALATSETHNVLVVTSVAGAEALNPGLPFRYREVGWFRGRSLAAVMVSCRHAG